jgi:hypothetical protein
LYRVFEGSSKPARVSTTGRLNAQQITLEGNPAIATIRKPLKYVKAEAARISLLLCRISFTTCTHAHLEAQLADLCRASSFDQIEVIEEWIVARLQRIVSRLNATSFFAPEPERARLSAELRLLFQPANLSPMHHFIFERVFADASRR